MYTRNRHIHIFFFIVVILACLPLESLSQTGVNYQKRSGRFEGIKPKPVSGYDIELISFLAAYREKGDAVPGQYKIRFNLERSTDKGVHITVRDLDARINYWLDRVEAPRPWAEGFGNEFAWSTNDVIKHVQGLDLQALGALVRIGSDHPTSTEHVAPAILYASEAPRQIREYLITVRVNGSARLSCKIYRAGLESPVWQETFRRQMGGIPLTIRWDAAGVARGTYTLLVNGFFLDSNRQFSQSVTFYHQPLVP